LPPAREDDTFSRADFTFDQERTIYTGPEGKPSTCSGQMHDGIASVRGQADPLGVSPIAEKPLYPGHVLQEAGRPRGAA